MNSNPLNGFAIIPAGQISVTVPYTSIVQPTIGQISVNSLDNLGGIGWFLKAAALTATTFEIDLEYADPMNSHSFGWQINLSGGEGSGGGSWVPFQPAFTTLNEVISHLNAAGPDSNGNYTVFGLTILVAAFQSQIDQLQVQPLSDHWPRHFDQVCVPVNIFFVFLLLILGFFPSWLLALSFCMRSESLHSSSTSSRRAHKENQGQKSRNPPQAEERDLLISVVEPAS